MVKLPWPELPAPWAQVRGVFLRRGDAGHRRASASGDRDEVEVEVEINDKSGPSLAAVSLSTRRWAQAAATLRAGRVSSRGC